MFFNTGQNQHSPLAKKLGCEITVAGGVKTGDYGQSTTTPGLYIVGDATRNVQFAVVAAAEAAEAACATNKALLKADNGYEISRDQGASAGTLMHIPSQEGTKIC
jgi:thioredoxin reductase